MYLVIFSRYMESDVYYFKNKRDLTKFFSFEELCLYDNCEVFKAKEINKPLLFYKK